MSTVQDLIESALGKIRIRAVGQTINSTILAQCLDSLEELRGLWANDNYIIYSYTEQEQNLVASTSSYTIGSGGDWNITRPQVIHHKAFIRDSGGGDHLVERITIGQYRDKASKIDSGRPNEFAYTPEYPLGVVYVNPVPTEVEAFHFRALNEITAFSSLDQTVSLPPGYKAFIVTNLAEYIAPDFGKAVSTSLERLARMTRRAIRGRNVQITEPTELDVALLSSGSPVGNILTG